MVSASISNPYFNIDTWLFASKMNGFVAFFNACSTNNLHQIYQKYGQNADPGANPNG